jgi:DNA gyrase subunit A
MGRATQGVKLINLGKRNQNDEIASVCVVDHEEDAENEGVVEDTENTTTTENNNE